MSLVRQLLVLLVLGAAGYGGYAYYLQQIAGTEEAAAPARGGRSRTVAVEVVAAEARSLAISVEAVGTTRALRSIDIVPLADGRLVENNIEPGARVQAGDVLVRLDAEIEEANLAEAEATLTEKAAARERAETLLRSNNVSRATIETARAEEAIARAAVDRARRRLADRTIVAPFGGTLGISNVDLGAFVETSTVLGSLDDLSEVEIEFRLPETFYGQIVARQTVTAESAAFPGRMFAGTVAGVDSRIDQVSRSFRVRARLPNPNLMLPAGMFMRLELALADRDAVVVPEEALSVGGTEAFLFVVEDGKARRRAVGTGLRRGGVVEIVTGLAAGEIVITKGTQSVSDGSAVSSVGAPPAGAGGTAAPIPERTRT